jgi:hypothetical protein
MPRLRGARQVTTVIDPDFEINSALLLAAAVVLRKLGVFWGAVHGRCGPPVGQR